jgi:single-stranded-DNA-specific exonuclease
VKGAHIRCSLGGRLKAIAWRAEGTELGARLLAGASLNVAGRLKADSWNGRTSVLLDIEDAADPRRV